MKKALWVIVALLIIVIVLGILGFNYILSCDWFFGA